MGFVNDVVKSDTAFPSGGVGRSGYGRECGSEGYKQFANIKVHYVNWNDSLWNLWNLNIKKELLTQNLNI